MGASKSQLFKTRHNAVAAMAKALAHPARIAILEVIAAKKGCICNDIVDELPLAQPTISQHLKELKKVGLIKGEVEGAGICYCLDKKRMEEIKTSIMEFFSTTITTSCC